MSDVISFKKILQFFQLGESAASFLTSLRCQITLFTSWTLPFTAYRRCHSAHCVPPDSAKPKSFGGKIFFPFPFPISQCPIELLNNFMINFMCFLIGAEEAAAKSLSSPHHHTQPEPYRSGSTAAATSFTARRRSLPLRSPYTIIGA